MLKDKGEAINEKSFYANMKRIEKDKSFGFRDRMMKKTEPGIQEPKIRHFPKREWFYKV